MKNIVSLHVPKTGGTLFKDYLFSFKNDVKFFDYGEGSVNTKLFFKNKNVECSNYEEYISQFNKLIDMNYTFIIHGHFNIRKYYHLKGYVDFITWIREPLRRLLSLYNYWSFHKPKKLIPQYIYFKDKKPSFEEFASDPLFSNQLHRYLNFTLNEYSFIGILDYITFSYDILDYKYNPQSNGPHDLSVRNPSQKKIVNHYTLNSKILNYNLTDYNLYSDCLKMFFNVNIST